MAKKDFAGEVFQVKDWLSDDKVMAASFHSQGLWFKILCFMKTDKSRLGVLAGTFEQLCNALGASAEEMQRFLDEAVACRFADIFVNGHKVDKKCPHFVHSISTGLSTSMSTESPQSSPQNVHIVNRRMQREARRREYWKNHKRSKRKGGTVHSLSTGMSTESPQSSPQSSPKNVHSLNKIRLNTFVDTHVFNPGPGGRPAGAEPSGKDDPVSYETNQAPKDPPAVPSGAVPGNLKELGKVFNLENIREQQSRHYSEKVGQFFWQIKADCDKITGLAKGAKETKRRQFRPHMVVQMLCNAREHPGLIAEVISEIAKRWDTIEDPMAYQTKLAKTLRQRFNEMESICFHEEIKKQERELCAILGLKHLLKSV